MRTTPSDLDSAAHRLSEMTGRNLSIQWAYGRPRLVEGGGYRDRSPRLPSGQLLDVLHGMMTGLAMASPHAARPQWQNGLVERCSDCLRPIRYTGPGQPGYNSKAWRHNPRRSR